MDVNSNSNEPRERTAERYRRAKEIIPGATQLLSKRAELFAPGQWPAYYRSATGAEVTDLDGNNYVDMSLMGIGACVLGYGDPAVDAAARKAIDGGVMSTLNPPEEVELAEELVGLHDWADKARFARSGGDAMAIAVRLARAHTGRDTVAFCGYHGWHDWYLAANLESTDALDGHLLPGLSPAGVPRGLTGTSKPFRYNDVSELDRIASENELSAIVMEPIRDEPPEAGFLERVEAISRRENAPLIVDEITAGFRVTPGGYHQHLDLDPDVAVYGKALGNGYPISAVVGREAVMDEAEVSFISSTFWTERIGPSAALATIEKFRAESVGTHLMDVGQRVKAGWERLAARHGIPLQIKGLDPLATFEFDVENDQAATTLFTQEMLDRGYLAGSSVYASYAHTDSMIEDYLSVVDDVFGLIADAIATETVSERLSGPAAHEKFERLN